jgi:hypothetical protein
MRSRRVRGMNKWARWPVVAVATLGAAALGAGVAGADEHYTGSGDTWIGPRYGLFTAGQIDDPFEDVLEHAAILGSHTITND